MDALNSAAPVEPGAAAAYSRIDQITASSCLVRATNADLLAEPVVDRGDMAGQLCVRNPFQTLLRRHLRPRYRKLRGHERCSVFLDRHRYSLTWVRRNTTLTVPRALLSASASTDKFAALQCKNLRRTALIVGAA